ncbi:hypothetical protein HanRHA438_Chr13g0602401 [Helianthus annuus]|nr:hypothetical protein HanRHA438_Chr13g0602401 [Helianthus annuus]
MGPQNPRGFPIYGYQGKAGYSLINVLDPKAGGAMVIAALPEGRPLWVDQIRKNFLHPTGESVASYADVVLGEDDGDDIDVDSDPTREEVIILSSEGSDESHQDPIHHSARAGPQRGTVHELVADDTRKKRKRDKTEEKKDEEPVAEETRKRPSNSSFLDYVIVSDTLSGLDAGDKRSERDPDDGATLTELMKRKKALEDKKKELDAQAAVALAEKKSKLQKDTATAPSELEVDLGVFSAKAGNLLEKVYKSASGSRAPKSGKGARKIDISKITPLASLPSKPLDLSPHLPDTRGKEKEDEVEQVRNVAEDVAAGTGGGEDYVEGVETNVESSEATPQQGTIYTKRVPGSGGGGAYGTRKSPEFTHVQSGSWDTHNPACDDLPHVPHWNLTRGSRMNDIVNCREFYSLSFPPAERMFQKKRHRMDLLDDHIHAGVNFYATCQEIVREWQLMGEDTLEFEVAKKELAEEKEQFNAERKGLLWRVSYAEDKLGKEKQFNANKRKEWETACERTNREMQNARDQIVQLKGEKTEISNEVEQERTLFQKRENKYIQCKAKLEKIASEKVAESKASEILAEETTVDCKWLLAHAVPLHMFELGQAAYNSGRKDGYSEGRAAVANNEKDYHFELYKQDCTVACTAKRREYKFIEFGIIKAVEKLSRKDNAIEVLKKALGD